MSLMTPTNVQDPSLHGLQTAGTMDIGSLLLSPEALLVYCESRLESIDGQVNDYFQKQQKKEAALDQLNHLQNNLPSRDANGDVVDLWPGTKANYKADLDEMKQAFQDAGLSTADFNVLYDKLTGGDDEILDKSEIAKVEDTIKNMQSSINTSNELDMISLQSLMSQRQTAVQLTTNMMNTMNDTAKSIVANMK